MKSYEERLSLIDEAVESLNGLFPPHEGKPDEVLWTGSKFGDLRRYQSYSAMYNTPCWDTQICTRTEFEQRAKELGYINGYKWGVEYETNGEKPNLPDDVVVSVERVDGQNCSDNTVNSMYWGASRTLPYALVKFRIVDKRYKPKDQSSQPEINKWLVSDSEPPTHLEIKASCSIDRIHEMTLDELKAVRSHVNAEIEKRVERDKLIEQAEDIIADAFNNSTDGEWCANKDIAAAFIEAGWRPQVKSDD